MQGYSKPESQYKATRKKTATNCYIICTYKHHQKSKNIKSISIYIII